MHKLHNADTVEHVKKLMEQEDRRQVHRFIGASFLSRLLIGTKKSDTSDHCDGIACRTCIAGLVDITIHLRDDDLDYWVQVAPGYTVSLQVRIRANCTEAEMRGDCTDYTMLLSIEIRERTSSQSLVATLV